MNRRAQTWLEMAVKQNVGKSKLDFGFYLKEKSQGVKKKNLIPQLPGQFVLKTDNYSTLAQVCQNDD
jgi:hypothetical protein